MNHFVQVWGYGPSRVCATVGYVPVEEYAFFVIQPILLCFALFVAQRRSGWRASLNRPCTGFRPTFSPLSSLAYHYSIFHYNKKQIPGGGHRDAGRLWSELQTASPRSSTRASLTWLAMFVCVKVMGGWVLCTRRFHVVAPNVGQNKH